MFTTWFMKNFPSSFWLTKFIFTSDNFMIEVCNWIFCCIIFIFYGVFWEKLLTFVENKLFFNNDVAFCYFFQVNSTWKFLYFSCISSTSINRLVILSPLNELQFSAISDEIDTTNVQNKVSSTSLARFVL